MKRVLFVARHGETDWNATGRLQGHTDVPLNENGRAQARALAENLRGASMRFAAVVTSDLSRARETGEIVAAELGIALAYVDEGLRERCFGQFEGHTRIECEERFPEQWRLWCERGDVPADAEASHLLALRVRAATLRAAERIARVDAAAIVITHGAALRFLLAHTKGKLGPPIANGAVHRLEWDGESFHCD